MNKLTVVELLRLEVAVMGILVVEVLREPVLLLVLAVLMICVFKIQRELTIVLLLSPARPITPNVVI
jgi:hypothetical protein